MPDSVTPELPKLGVIAGGGDLPEQIVESCLGSGRDVFIAAIEGEANLLAYEALPHIAFHLGAVGKALDAFREAGVQEVVLAGRVKRPSFSALDLDMQGVKLLARITKSKILGDNAVLSTVMKFLEDQGFTPVGAETLLEDFLAPVGAIGALKPKDATAKADIERGLEVVRALGALDIGQAVVVQQGVVLGVEAAEGTDGLLARVGSLRLEGEAGVLIKCKKPGQEKRVDLPTIGVTTIENAHKAGLRGIAVEAGGALIINRKAVAKKADELGVFVMGV